MTNEKRQFITLDEIIGIQYKCNKCGTTLIIPREKWGYPIQQCPNLSCNPDPLHAGRWIRIESGEGKEMAQLQNAIKALTALSGVDCMLSLEIRTEEKHD